MEVENGPLGDKLYSSSRAPFSTSMGGRVRYWSSYDVKEGGLRTPSHRTGLETALRHSWVRHCESLVTSPRRIRQVGQVEKGVFRRWKRKETKIRYEKNPYAIP